MKSIGFFIALIFAAGLLLSCTPKTKTIYMPAPAASGGNPTADPVTSFGAIPDDKIDDTDAIIKAFKAESRSIYFPPGTYLISKPITVPNDIIIQGSSNTILKATKHIDNIFNLRGDYTIQNFQIQNLTFDGNKMAKNCIYILKASNNSPSPLIDLRFHNAKEDGAVLVACQTSGVYNLQATRNGGNGIALKGCNGIRVYNISCNHNKKNGLLVTTFAQVIYDNHVVFSAGVNIYGFDAQNNGENGAAIIDVQTMASFYGGWMEGNGKDGFHITGSSANIEGFRLAGGKKCENEPGYHSVHIYKGKIASDVTFHNCFITGPINDWYKVRDEYDGNNVVTTNVHRFNGEIISKELQEILGDDLIQMGEKTSWKPWYKSTVEQSNIKGKRSLKINPKIARGGAEKVFNSVPNRIVKLTTSYYAPKGCKVTIVINPNNGEAIVDNTTYKKAVVGTGQWETINIYYLSKNKVNLVWYRVIDSKKPSIHVEEIEVREVTSFRKVCTEFIGNMNPMYREVIPTILR